VEASRRHVDRDQHGLAAHPEESAACGIKAMRNSVLNLMAASAIAATLSVSAAHAQKKYDAGATDTEIKVGQTVPLSGPASAYATIGKTQSAYIKMINDRGGVNGRMINLIQYDDAYSPPKTVERVRKLVEGAQVLLKFPHLGDAR